MTILSKAKMLWRLYGVYNQIKEAGKMDIKTVAGWLKIVGYVASLAALVLGYLKPETVLAVTIILSAVVKLAEAIVSITPGKDDDAIAAQVKAELAKNGLIKE